MVALAFEAGAKLGEAAAGAARARARCALAPSAPDATTSRSRAKPRRYLALFAGEPAISRHDVFGARKLRKILLSALRADGPSANYARNSPLSAEEVAEMGRAHFCLVPRGGADRSYRRLFDAILHLCIPGAQRARPQRDVASLPSPVHTTPRR